MTSRIQIALVCLVFFLVAAFPFRSGLISDHIVGAGPDVVSSLWGMWWFQTAGLSALGGGETDLVNYPQGAMGSVLSPSSALMWAVFEPLFGVGRASALVAVFQMLGIALGCYILARQAKLSVALSCFAAFLPLVGRYLVFSVGEASVVAIANAAFPLGLAALIAASRSTGRWKHAFAASFCMAWCAFENPYLAPVLPAIALLIWLFSAPKISRSKVVVATITGVLGIFLVAILFSKGANPEYPREIDGQQVGLFGVVFQIIDLPWARMNFAEPFWSSGIEWTTDSETGTTAKGGRYMGFSVILLSAYAVLKSWKEAKPWLGLALVGFVFSMGSLAFGVAFPFLFLNELMNEVARPLTQPTRYLVLALVSLSVLGAMGMSAIIKEKGLGSGVAIGAIVILDAVFLGGLSLTPPNTQMPQFECRESLNGPVLVWPADAVDGEMGPSQLLQMRHEQSAAHTGIASWALIDNKRVQTQLRGAGFALGSSRLNLHKLSSMGYRHVIAEAGEEQVVLQRSLGKADDSCEGWSLYAIPAQPRMPAGGGR